MKQTLIISACLLGFVGCAESNRPADLPPLTPCTLTVTQGGTPLSDAMLIFHRSDETTDKNWIFMGTTDSAGVCVPAAIGQYPGLLPGQYRVTVRKVWMEPRDDLSEAIAEKLPAALEVLLVDAKYTDAAKTPLAIEVKAKEKNVLTLPLDAAPATAVIPPVEKWPSTKYRK